MTDFVAVVLFLAGGCTGYALRHVISVRSRMAEKEVIVSDPNDSWKDRAMGAILAVTLIGLTLAWVGGLALVVEKFFF
jgi:hypothetical protein